MYVKIRMVSFFVSRGALWGAVLIHLEPFLDPNMVFKSVPVCGKNKSIINQRRITKITPLPKGLKNQRTMLLQLVLE